VQVYVESFGCSQNQGEGAGIVRDLSSHGHGIAPSPAGADVGILVTCGVIGPTEARMVRRWQALSARVPRVVVTGCLVPLRTELMTGPGRERTTFVPIRDQDHIPALLDSWSDGASGTLPMAPAPTDPPLSPIRRRKWSSPRGARVVAPTASAVSLAAGSRA